MQPRWSVRPAAAAQSKVSRNGWSSSPRICMRSQGLGCRICSASCVRYLSSLANMKFRSCSSLCLSNSLCSRSSRSFRSASVSAGSACGAAGSACGACGLGLSNNPPSWSSNRRTDAQNASSAVLLYAAIASDRCSWCSRLAQCNYEMPPEHKLNICRKC